MQILYALVYGIKNVDFTHYDLNYKKIRVREVENKKMFQIRYETEKGIEYIQADRVATIIDYSYSHAVIPNILDENNNLIIKSQHIGKYGELPYSIYPDRSWIFHDLYKFLLFSGNAAIKNNNQQVLQESRKMFKFFNKEQDLTYAIEKEFEIKYSFPYANETINLRALDYATYIRTVCDCDFIYIVPSNLEILYCDKICTSSDMFYKTIGLDTDAEISPSNNIVEFYDIANRLKNEDRNEELDRLIKNFTYTNAIAVHKEKIKNLISQIKDARSNMKLVDLKNLTEKEIFDPTVVNLVKSSYTSIGKIIDKNIDLDYYAKVGIAVATTYQDEASVNEIKNMMDKYKEDNINSLSEAKSVVDSNHAYLDQLLVGREAFIKSKIRENSSLSWYWNERNIYDTRFDKIF